MLKTLRKTAIVLAIFATGALSGLALSKYAAPMHKKIILIGYSTQHEFLAEESWNKGDFESAAMHFWARIQLNHPAEDYSFLVKGDTWELDFPLAAPILSAIYPEEESTSKHYEGVMRGQYASALYKLGRTQEADEQYVLASELTGFKMDSEAFAKFKNTWLNTTYPLSDELKNKKAE